MEDTNFTYEERLQQFLNVISTKTEEGYMVVDKNEKALVVVLLKPGGKINHLLNFLLSCISCGLWIIVWVILALISPKEKTIKISIDNTGNVIEEIINI